jgi:heat shock protein HtpX
MPIKREASAGAIVDRNKVAAALRRNWTASIVLAAAMTLIGAVVGYTAGWAADVVVANEFSTRGRAPGLFWYSNWGVAGALALLLFGTVMCGRALVFGDSIIARWVGGHEAREVEMPGLHAAMAKVARAAGEAKPRLVVIDSEAMNAFAAGRDPLHGTIGVTTGLLNGLAPDELEAVLGHEMTHLVNRDVVYADIVAIAVGLTVMLRDLSLAVLRNTGRGSSRSRSKSSKDGGGAALIAIAILVVVLVVAPLMAKLVQIAISREREYAADAGGAFLAGSPDPLIRALHKIQSCKERLEVSHAVQHVFIVNPLRNFKEKSGALLSTHPATSLRIKRLKSLAV